MMKLVECILIIGFIKAGLSRDLGKSASNSKKSSAPTPKPSSKNVFAPVTTPVITPVIAPVTAPVTPSGLFISTDKASYLQGEQIIVSFGNPAPMELDWIGIYYCNGINISYEYTGGLASGNVTFDSPSAGCFKADYHNGNDENLIDVHLEVVAAPPATITTNKINYQVDETIEVTFRIPFPTEYDWVGLYKCNDDDTMSWAYTNGAYGGNHTILNAKAGCYYSSLFNSADKEIAYTQFHVLDYFHF